MTPTRAHARAFKKQGNHMSVIIGWVFIALSIFGLFDPQNWTGMGLGGGFTLLFFGLMLVGGAWNMGGGKNED